MTGETKTQIDKAATISNANSSLTAFSFALSNGRGLLLQAVEKDGVAQISYLDVPVNELPQESDAVCKVDWGWIYGSTIAAVTVSASAVRFGLQPAGPLVVSVQTWQGKPFLAFQPFKPSPNSGAK